MVAAQAGVPLNIKLDFDHPQDGGPLTPFPRRLRVNTPSPSDPSLLSALNNEILHEEGGDDSVDVKTSDIQIGDFVKSVEGATIMLTKRQGDETIRVCDFKNVLNYHIM